MNIAFEHITAKNFMSFKSLDLNLKQFEKQTVLISGRNEDIQSTEYQVMNGSGKTTILNAILYSVYGETLKPLKSKMIANWGCGPKDDVEVSLTVTSGGTAYAIQRLLKGKARSGELHVFRQNSDSGEWDEITLSTMSETQRMIETDIVPCGKDGFLRCIILTADQEYNFFRLSKSAKDSFFESLFELTTYTEMYEKLHRMTLDATSGATSDSRLIDTLNENILKLKKERDASIAMASEVKDAESALNSSQIELEKYSETHEPFETVKERCDSEHSEFKRTIGAELKKKLSDFDKDNGILSVSKDGTIRIDETSFNDKIAEGLNSFDCSHRDEVEALNKTVAETENFISNQREKISNGRNAAANASNERLELDRELLDFNKTVSHIESRISAAKGLIEVHKSTIEILCSDCKRKYEDYSSIGEHRKEIASLESKLAAINGKISELNDKIAVNAEYIKSCSECTEKLENDIEKAIKTVESNTKRLSEIAMERKSTEQKLTNDRDIFRMTLQSKRNELKSAIVSEYNAKVSENKSEKDSIAKTSENEWDALKRRVSDAKYRYDVLISAKKKSFDEPIAALNGQLESAKNSLDRANCDISHYKALEEILKPENLRKSVVSDMLKELNFRINGYLSKMGSNYSCTFDEDFDATFTSSNGIETSYNNFSAGESMRLSIACCLAFKDFMQVRLDIHSNLLMIDEYIDSNLDQMAVNEIMDFIRFMVGSEKIAALIISHRTEVKDNLFDSEILVVKKNNESRILINGKENNT